MKAKSRAVRAERAREGRRMAAQAVPLLPQRDGTMRAPSGAFRGARRAAFVAAGQPPPAPSGLDFGRLAVGSMDPAQRSEAR